MREGLYEAHEDSVAQASQDIVARRIAFLDRLKGRFDEVQRASKENKNEHKRLLKKGLSFTKI